MLSAGYAATQSQEVLSRIFSSSSSSCGYFSFVNKFYDLPECTSELDTEDRAYFEAVSRKDSFVNLVLYTDTGWVYLLMDVSGSTEEYYLPARSVGRGETMVDAVRSLHEDTMPGFAAFGFEAVATVLHTFRYSGTGGTHVMKGVAFIARVIDPPGLGQTPSQPTRMGEFFRFSEARELLMRKSVRRYSNSSVLSCAMDHVESFSRLGVEQPDEEIRQNEAVTGRYRVHEYFAKPVFKILKKGKSLDSLIFDNIGSPNTFLDASCGDSLLVQKVARYGAQICVANDICWSQIEMVRGRLPRDVRNTVFFTNHNVVSLPFKDQSFDVVLLKNTLHHLRAADEFRLALEGLLRIGKKLVIVEVAPEAGRLAKLINRLWYQFYLKDAGQSFFSEGQFREAIESSLQMKDGFTSEFSVFRSSFADYCIAVVEHS